MAIPGIPRISETGNAGAGAAPASCVWLRCSPKPPKSSCFPGPPGTRHLIPLVTCLWRQSPSLERLWVPIWGNSHCISHPPFPPGLWPLPTMGRGLNFMHQSPGLLDLRKKRVFCGYFFTFCFKLCWNDAGFIPRENCPSLHQENRIELKAGDCFSWRRS